MNPLKWYRRYRLRRKRERIADEIVQKIIIYLGGSLGYNIGVRKGMKTQILPLHKTWLALWEAEHDNR